MSGEAGPLRLLVVQPTPFCNLDCRYCYLPDRANRARMDVATFRRLTGLIARHDAIAPEGLRVVWHGGEPLAAGVALLREFSMLLRDAVGGRFPLHFGMQTNATLLDPAWCDYIREFNVDVGVSIDGPRELHDLQRRHRSGRGSHDAAMRGIALLRSAGIAFDVIAVLTRASLDRAAELLPFFESIGARGVGFNVEEIEGANRSSSLDEAAADEAMDRFWSTLARSAGRLCRPLPVREIDDTLERIHLHGTRFDDQWRPLKIVTCDWRGGLSTFSPELIGAPAARFADFVFARVDGIARLDDMLASPALQDAARRIADGTAACARGCAYFAACGGGMPANKFFETGMLEATETLFCRLAIQAPIRQCLAYAGQPGTVEAARNGGAG